MQVEVTGISTSRTGGTDCRDRVQIFLRAPLGDRIVVDKPTGQSVNVTTGDSSSELL